MHFSRWPFHIVWIDWYKTTLIQTQENNRWQRNQHGFCLVSWLFFLNWNRLSCPFFLGSMVGITMAIAIKGVIKAPLCQHKVYATKVNIFVRSFCDFKYFAYYWVRIKLVPSIQIIMQLYYKRLFSQVIFIFALSLLVKFAKIKCLKKLLLLQSDTIVSYSTSI